MRTMDENSLPQRDYLETKEYRRFAELADSCTQYRYIGLCHGEPGVGKSWAAEHYCHWQDTIIKENLVNPISAEMRVLIQACRGIRYVAPVTNTPKIMANALMIRINGYGFACSKARGETDSAKIYAEAEKSCPLIIIDEADRLAYHSLEEVRSLYDEHQFGLILIGMPGMEKRLSRYPQLYSRIGFNHEFRKLSADETRFILERKFVELNQVFDANRFSDVEAVNAILRITAGNHRLLERLFSQVKRIMMVNRLETISKEVVDAARTCLLMGSTT